MISHSDYKNILSLYCSEVNADHILISKITKSDPLTVETICYLENNKELTNFSYPVENAPCKQVFTQGFYMCNANVKSLFPKDFDLQRLFIESYAGICIYSKNELFGHIAVLSRKPIKSTKRIYSSLKKCAEAIEKKLL